MASQNSHIRAAPAEVSAHPFFDLFVGELQATGAETSSRHRACRTFLKFLDHPDRRTDLSGRAIPALKTVVLDKRSLQRMQIPATELRPNPQSL